MTKQPLLLLMLSLAALAFTSCQMKKKYYHKEGKEKEKLIEAYSCEDTAANNNRTAHEDLKGYKEKTL
jgi:hypothetical protein